MAYCCCCRYPLQFWPFCAFAFWPLAVGVGPPTPFRPVTQVFIHKKRKATRAAERRCQPETAFGIQSAASRLAKVQAKDVPSNQSTNARDILFNRVLRNRCVNCTYLRPTIFIAFLPRYLCDGLLIFANLAAGCMLLLLVNCPAVTQTIIRPCYAPAIVCSPTRNGRNVIRLAVIGGELGARCSLLFLLIRKWPLVAWHDPNLA